MRPFSKMVPWPMSLHFSSLAIGSIGFRPIPKEPHAALADTAPRMPAYRTLRRTLRFGEHK